MIKFKTKLPEATKPVEPPPLPAGEIAGGDDQPLFKIKDFPQNFLTYHIHKAAPSQRAPRHHNIIHASDLDPARRWCPREPALLTRDNLKRPSEFVATAQKMTWGMGYKGAELLMDLIPDAMIWGHWKCRACAHEMKFTYTPKACGKCGGARRALRYEEVLLRDPVTGVIGSVDLFVDLLGNGAKTPIEIKTEGNDSFKKRTAATFDHQWRTKLYMYLAARTPEVQAHGINTEEGRVIYFTKEGWADEPRIKEWKLGDWAKSSIKEYFVPRDDSMVQNALDDVILYRTWREQFEVGTLPQNNPLPARICTAPTDGRAKSCAACKACWA